MANSGGHISKPISVEDVASVLGVNSTDIGTLCRSTKINKWSKYKPIRNNTNFGILNESEFKEANYGFNIPRYSSAITLKNSLASAGWIYQYANGIYRLTDFNNYSHRAPKILPSLEEQTIETPSSPAIPITIPTTLPFITTDEYALQLSDLLVGDMYASVMEDMYLGIALTKDGNTTYITNGNHIEGGTKGIYGLLTVKFPALPSGDYQAFIFASSVVCNATSVPNSGTYISLDQTFPVTLTFKKGEAEWSIVVRASAVDDTLAGSASTGKYRVTYSVTFTSSKPLTFPNMYVYILNAPEYSQANVIASESLGNVECEGESSTVRNNNRSPLEVNGSTGMFIYVQSGTDARYNSGSPVGVVRPIPMQ